MRAWEAAITPQQQQEQGNEMWQKIKAHAYVTILPQPPLGIKNKFHNRIIKKTMTICWYSSGVSRPFPVPMLKSAGPSATTVVSSATMTATCTYQFMQLIICAINMCCNGCCGWFISPLAYFKHLYEYSHPGCCSSGSRRRVHSRPQRVARVAWRPGLARGGGRAARGVAGFAGQGGGLAGGGGWGLLACGGWPLRTESLRRCRGSGLAPRCPGAGCALAVAC